MCNIKPDLYFNNKVLLAFFVFQVIRVDLIIESRLNILNIVQ